MTDEPYDRVTFAETSREQVISQVPFVVRRVARWSECDPAGVVYTGNFSEYLLSAVHLFRRHALGRDWGDIRRELEIDLPAKALNMIFSGSLWPDDAFDTHLHVGEIRNRTFDFLAHAKRAGTDETVFFGRLTAICVSGHDRRISCDIPEPLRQQLNRQKASSPASDDLIAVLR